MFFGRETDAEESGEDSDRNEIELFTDESAEWDGIITNFRLDPMVTTGDFAVAYVIFYKVTENRDDLYKKRAARRAVRFFRFRRTGPGKRRRSPYFSSFIKVSSRICATTAARKSSQLKRHRCRPNPVRKKTITVPTQSTPDIPSRTAFFRFCFLL